jgi:hypothetical protein
MTRYPSSVLVIITAVPAILGGIAFGAQDRYTLQVPNGVCAENLDSDVLVMQPANQGIRHNASDPLNWARDRCILGQ